MNEYIYQADGKFWREVTDLLGKTCFREEITEAEYYLIKQEAGA